MRTSLGSLYGGFPEAHSRKADVIFDAIRREKPLRCYSLAYANNYPGKGPNSGEYVDWIQSLQDIQDGAKGERGNLFARLSARLSARLTLVHIAGRRRHM